MFDSFHSLCKNVGVLLIVMNENTNRTTLLEDAVTLIPYLDDYELINFVQQYSLRHYDRISYLPKDSKFLLIQYLQYFDVINLLSTSQAWKSLNNEKIYYNEWLGCINRKLNKMHLKRRFNFISQVHFKEGVFSALHKKYSCIGVTIIDVYLFVTWMNDYGRNFFDFTNIQKKDYTNIDKLFVLYSIWLNARKQKLNIPTIDETTWSKEFLYIPNFNTRIWYSGPVDVHGIYKASPTVINLLGPRPLRQLGLGRHAGHDDRARRDPRRRA